MANGATVQFLHHGAAVSSHRGVVGWIPPISQQKQQQRQRGNDDNPHDSTQKQSSSTLVYASHSVLNFAQPDQVVVSSSSSYGKESTESVWHVTDTLCTATTKGKEDGPDHVITCLASVVTDNNDDDDDARGRLFTAAIVCGFADGTVVLWVRRNDDEVNNNMNNNELWNEINVQDSSISSDSDETKHPITCIDAVWVEGEQPNHARLVILVGTSDSAKLYQCQLSKETTSTRRFAQAPPQDPTKQERTSSTTTTTTSRISMTQCQATVLLEYTAVCSVNFRQETTSLHQILALIGTAAPRHNKIHVFYASSLSSSLQGRDDDPLHFHYSGALLGHEDWITCMAWTPPNANTNSNTTTTATTTTPTFFLATGSQDARIRLWKFSTTTTTTTNNTMVARTSTDESNLPESSSDIAPSDDDEFLSDDNDDDNRVHHQDEEEEGESRLDIAQNNNLTHVTLEALLMGHEEAITSLCWYNHAKAVYNQDHLLVSSSMDRSILLWTPGEVDGIWTPLTRVGSAGGILGGSVGSTLLGYLAATMEPTNGSFLIGHAYGGALHVWNLDGNNNNHDQESTMQQSAAELAARLYWRATPCVTGHFSGVVDLCWEASAGHYLLTASMDQTCRLWAPAKRSSPRHEEQQQPIWLELARPQVHGYNLTAVTSLSSPQHPHFIVTGADEKELRAFDAPHMSLNVLKAISGGSMEAMTDRDPIQRVERAYIPSLGLRNKATAAEGAEEDTPEGEPSSSSSINASFPHLPLERDLGAVSLWPEVQKLFGHSTELYCVTSTLEAKSLYEAKKNLATDDEDVLVASACKARNEEAAAIRLWKAVDGICYQVLSGGHKSTVASLAFSPDGTILASSGKDRRLCLWQRQENGLFKLGWTKESAHKRIVWSVNFLPRSTNGSNKGSQILASGSRDGCVKIWSIQHGSTQSGQAMTTTIEANCIHSFAPLHQVGGKADSVTAVSFCPHIIEEDVVGSGVALLALGVESGRLELWNIPIVGNSCCTHQETRVPCVNVVFSANLCHKATVTKLAWRPICNSVDDEEEGSKKLILASCSMDHGCRIFDVLINPLQKNC